MQVYTDGEYINGFTLEGELITDDMIEVSEPEDLDHFVEHFEAYKVEDGKLLFDEDKQTELDSVKAKEEIRTRREEECFSVINRGSAWYELLTEEQKAELQTWYQAWLDAPETGVIPDKPTWL